MRDALRGAAAAMVLALASGPAAWAAPQPPPDAQPAAHQWTRAQAAELIAALGDADRHALNAGRWLTVAREANGPDRDQALTAAALAYAAALARGVVDPQQIHGIFTLHRNQVDLGVGLERALASGTLRTWLSSLAPQDAEYAALSRAYVQALDETNDPARPDIPAGELIRPGDSDPRLGQIARRLGILPAATYGPEMVAAVKRFQTDSGLAVDGVVGPDTLEALNAGPRERARQLAVNLERRRWLVRQPPRTRIDVNIAATRLTYVRDGRAAWRTRVIAGAPGHETPLLEESFHQLVVNPPWYVPQSIAQAEILPKGRGYLRAHDMYVDDGRVIQRPGPNAALGQVKFDMQNRYAIYLHDTPAKRLFERVARHRSHGCVRVQDAIAFARSLASERGVADRFDAVLASGDTGVVELGAPVHVRLLYRTAFVGVDGAVEFRPDVYGWDERVAEALGLGKGRFRARLPVKADELSP